MPTVITAEADPPSATEPPRVPQHGPRSGNALRVLAILAVIVALWWARSFLIPVTAGLMLAVMVAPLTQQLTRLVRSRTAATTLSMLVVIAVFGLTAAGFGSQLARVADRAPDMISLVAQQLAQTDAGADSVMARARQAFSELDRAAERLSGTRQVAPSRRRAAAAAAAQAAAAASAAEATTGRHRQNRHRGAA